MTVLGHTRAVPDRPVHRSIASATGVAPAARGVGRGTLPVLTAGTHLIATAASGLLVSAAGAAPTPTLLLALGWLLLLFLGTGARAPQARSRAADVLTPVWRTTATTAALGWATLAAAGATQDVHLAAAVQLALTAVLSGAGRAALLSVRTAPTLVMLAGASRDVEALAEELRSLARGWVLAPTCPLDEEPDAERLTRTILAGAARSGADAVLTTAGTRLTPAELRRLTWGLERLGVDLLVPTGVRDVAPSRTTALSAGPVGLLHVVRPGAPPAVHRLKYTLERGAAALLLLLALPLCLVVALAVRREDGGPVLYRQTRCGRHAVPFTMYKFRTMSPDADDRRAALEASGDTVEQIRESSVRVLFKMQSDPRLTRIGTVLRRYSIDELPQLWNVVLGDMALVGPRPALPNEVQHYDVDAWRRLTIRPGVTGLWQVSGRSDLSWKETVRLDLHYVDNWSWRLDLSVLLRTVTAVLGHRGAY